MCIRDIKDIADLVYWYQLQRKNAVSSLLPKKPQFITDFEQFLRQHSQDEGAVHVDALNNLKDLLDNRHNRQMINMPFAITPSAKVAKVLNRYLSTLPKQELFQKDSYLGSGSYGCVNLHTYKRSGQTTLTVVEKRSQKDSDRIAPDIAKEIQLFESMPSHPNIIGYILPTDLSFLMEYAEGGSVQDRIEKPISEYATIGQRVEWAKELLAGLKHLQDHRIIHRDIKPQNLLLKGNTLKITDLGLAFNYGANKLPPFVCYEIAGTKHYISPEYKDGKVLDHGQDVFSSGITVWQMFYQQEDAKNFKRYLANYVEKSEAKESIHQVDKAIVQLSSPDPEYRASISCAQTLFSKLHEHQEIKEIKDKAELPEDYAAMNQQPKIYRL